MPQCAEALSIGNDTSFVLQLITPSLEVCRETIPTKISVSEYESCSQIVESVSTRVALHPPWQ